MSNIDFNQKQNYDIKEINKENEAENNTNEETEKK